LLEKGEGKVQRSKRSEEGERESVSFLALSKEITKVNIIVKDSISKKPFYFSHKWS
jgi:hypothetical protein